VTSITVKPNTGTVQPLFRSLDQELVAILRRASLECPVCGEFLLHRVDGIGCPECGLEIEHREGAAGQVPGWLASS
jgi:predicted RNA-binding Zn-ribbon protein involved in translation (DUF1610 family)